MEERNPVNKSVWKYVAIAMIAGFAIVMLIVFAPSIRASVNTWEHDIQKADDATAYETLKKVEDTCRAYIASYEADKITYMTNVSLESDVAQETAQAAKTRANRTAATYNSYYLQNSYIWKDSVPSDIKRELPYIE